MTGTTVAVEGKLDWDLFAERYWDREPVLYTGLDSAPFDAGESFAAAVAAASPVGGDRVPGGVQLMAERRRLLTAAGRTPCLDDGDFEAYAERVGGALGGRRHALVVAGLHAYSRELWQRERVFFRPLWERVGLPMTTAITTLFHGNYEHSPVGVHKDRFGTFMYVLSGRKRMRMWGERPWSHDASTVLDYGDHLGGSVAAEVSAGELLYWPSSYFHVGETVGADAATSVNVGVPREGRRVEYEIGELVAEVPMEAQGEADAYLAGRLPGVRAGLFAGVGGGVPEALRQGVEEAAGMLGRAWDGARRVEVTLNRYTAGGFRPAPSPGAVPEPRESMRVRRGVHAAIFWARTGEETAVCSANGHVVGDGVSPEVLGAVLGRLLPGEAVAVGDVLAMAGGEREAVRGLLGELWAVGAVAVDG